MKNKYIISLFLLVLTLSFSSSCKKEDIGDGKVPEIVVLGINPLYWALDYPYVDAGAIAYDVVDGDTIDLTGNIVVTSSVNVSAIGDYTVKYNVTDGSGLSAAEKVRNVKVVVGKK